MKQNEVGLDVAPYSNGYFSEALANPEVSGQVD